MAFHRRLTGADLHAPSILQIENFGRDEILKGDVLVVVGYNAATRRYLVIRGVDLPEFGTTIDAAIYGIANETSLQVLEKGSMTAFGIVEELEVIPSPDTAGAPDIAVAPNRPIYIDKGFTSTNVGRLVTGMSGNVDEAGLIISVTSANIVTAFIFSLTSALRDFVPNRAFKTMIPFDTTGAISVDGEVTLDLAHNSSKIDVVAQFFEYQEGSTSLYRGGVLDLDWKPTVGNEFNSITITVPEFAVSLNPLVGYMEIIY